jgi:hypothetical protein
MIPRFVGAMVCSDDMMSLEITTVNKIIYISPFPKSHYHNLIAMGSKYQLMIRLIWVTAFTVAYNRTLHHHNRLGNLSSLIFWVLGLFLGRGSVELVIGHICPLNSWISLSYAWNLLNNSGYEEDTVAWSALATLTSCKYTIRRLSDHRLCS